MDIKAVIVIEAYPLIPEFSRVEGLGDWQYFEVYSVTIAEIC